MRESSKNHFSRQQKYIDRSLIARYANDRFFQTIIQLLAKIEFSSVLDAGCGEGISLNTVRKNYSPSGILTGIDLDVRRVFHALQETKKSNIFVANVQNIPFPTHYFDLVICLETLEHVGEPILAIEEIARVSKKYALFSVPNEPWWRLANMVRGKYWSDLGNTPGHINHWSARTFRSLLEGNFRIVDTAFPVMWNFVLVMRKD
jgi:ubiquinone/menaquinone biosynthesis C-methylase UbiE